MAVNLGSAYLQVEPSTSGLVPGMRKAFGDVEREAGKSGERSGREFADKSGKGTGGVKGLITKLGLIGLGVQAGQMFASEFGSAISEASNLEQSVGGLEAVFKDSFGEMDKAAQTASRNLGLSRNEYNELATVLGAGLKNKGVEDFAGQTQDLIGLGADLSAMYGGTASDAVSAISSLMRGEADPIERYGVAISETAINAELAAKGQDKLTGAALESAKAQARLDILMRQTADAHGALDRESDSVAAKQQRMGAQWDDLKGKLGQGFLPVVSSVVGFFSDRLLPGLEDLSDAWSNQEGPIGRVREAFDTVVAGVRDFVMPIFDAWTGTIRDHVLPVLDRLWAVVRDEIGPVFLDMVGVVRDRVLPILQQIWKFVAEKVAPVLWDLANRVVVPVFQMIGSAIKTAWELVIKPALGAIDTILRTVIGPAFEWLWEKVVSPVFRFMGNTIGEFASGFRELFDGLRAAAAKPINFIIDAVWNNGLRKLIGMIPGVSEPGAIPLISIPSSGGGRGSSGGSTAVRAYARGGILPGFSRIADGDDQLIWARRGEGITISEALDSYERQRLLALNAAVARGQSPSSFRAGLEAHAAGGIVGFRGHRFTPRFIQSLLQAEATSGQTMYISQGGFRPRTSYSGTSHQGDAVDIVRPITTALITALRAAGIAAWDRTGKGDWAPHIHGVPLPGYGTAGGSAIWQAQDYLRGGDGLGGSDNGPHVAAGPNLLTEIPKLFGQVRDALGGLTGPWGELLKTGMQEAMSRVYQAATEKVMGLVDMFKEMLGISSPARAYARGTSYAAPGLAWVGEEGPELVRFRGGEQVHTARQSAAMAQPTLVRIELVDERLRELFRAEVRQMQREGLVAA